MKHLVLRCAQLCVAATISAVLAVPASASPETIVVKRGDTLETLARKHGVTRRDIARANDISVDTDLRKGRRLTIPDGTRTVSKRGNMRRPAKVLGDRVSLRRGPNEDYKRLTLLDDGERLIATRKSGDWIQVKLPDGDSGWIRGDFLKLGKELPAPKVAAIKAKPKAASVANVKPPFRKKVASAARISHKRAMPMYPKKVGKNSAVRAITGRANAHSITETRVEQPSESADMQFAVDLDRLPTEVPDRSSSRNERLSRVQPGPADSNARTGVIRTAFAYRGVPYRFGGTSRRGIDCSAFTGAVYRSHGVKLPRTAREQSTRGEKIAYEDMRSGDLVFFHTTRAGISHVGMYIGSGKFVHASSKGGGVRVDSITEGYYRNRFRGARRVKQSPE